MKMIWIVECIGPRFVPLRFGTVRLALVAASTVLLHSGCAKMDGDAYVAESLPLTAVEAEQCTCDPAHTLDVEIGFDSARCGERIFLLHNLRLLAAGAPPTTIPAAQDPLITPCVRLTSAIGSFHAEIQENFNAQRFPGLRHVALSVHDLDVDGNGTLDDVFLLTYADSVVLFGLDEDAVWNRPFLDMAFGAPSGVIEYACLALWLPQGVARRILVVRGSSTTVAKDRFLDTLYFLDLTSHTVLRRAVGGSQLGLGKGYEVGVCTDSLLILRGIDFSRGLACDSVDDNHRYLCAYRPDGTRAWRVVLNHGRTEKMEGGSIPAPGPRVFSATTRMAMSAQDSSTLEINEGTTGRQLRCIDVPGKVADIFSIPVPHESGRFLCLMESGEVRVYDSLLHERKRHDVGVSLEIDWGAQATTCDINGDGVPDVPAHTQSRQLLILDGTTTLPLAALPFGDRVTNLQFAFVRVPGETPRILMHNGFNQFALYAIHPTPFLTRLGPHRAAIWTAVIVLLLLPGATFAARRINYLRRLFLHLSARSESQGVIVLRGANRVRSVNGPARRMLALPDAPHPALDTLPD